MATYQIKMALKYLQTYVEGSSEAKTAAYTKFKRHVANIDPNLKNTDLETDHSSVMSHLILLQAEKHNERKRTEEEHVKHSAEYFTKSLDQKFYSALYEDRVNSQETLKTMIELRQLHYEITLGASTEYIVGYL